MKIAHHPSDEVLTDYAAGRLGRGPALVVFAHLAACPACCAEAERREAVGGALLGSLPAADLEPGALEGVLARLDGESPRPSPDRGGVKLSGVLKDVPLGPRRWLGPGLWMRRISRDRRTSGVTYLLRSGPGRRLPRHSHTGSELVCVIEGGFTDETGHYGPGDFAQSGAELLHAPATDPGEACLCLISAEGPMRMRDVIGRLVQPFVGL